MLPRFQGEHLQQNLELVRRLESIASRTRCSTSQLALAWILAKGNDLVPIPGTKRRTYLEENVAAVEIALSEAALREIGAAFPAEAVAGTRYPAPHMPRVNA